MTAAYDEQETPLIDVVGVAGNRRFGHIALGQEFGPAAITFCDMGPVLRPTQA